MAGSGRSTRNVVLFSVLTAIGALALVSGIGWIRVLADDGLRSRATTEVAGRLVDGYRPTDEEALVTWDDQDGEEQTTWFVLDEPERWAPGQPFRVRYDPAEVDEDAAKGPFGPKTTFDRQNVVAVEAGAHNVDHATGWDYWLPSAVIGGVVFLVLLAWALRGWRARKAAAAPSTPMRVVVLRGHSGNLGAKESVALLLIPPESPLDAERFAELQDVPREVPGARWQRVYWHPALEQLTPGRTVLARMTEGFGARAVIEPEPGVRVWPAGGLRAKARRGIEYTVQRTRTRPRYTDPVRPPLAVWLVPIPAGLLGAARGHLLADAPLVILGLVVVTTFLWAWYTPAPEG